MKKNRDRLKKSISPSIHAALFNLDKLELGGNSICVREVCVVCVGTISSALLAIAVMERGALGMGCALFFLRRRFCARTDGSGAFSPACAAEVNLEVNDQPG